MKSEDEKAMEAALEEAENQFFEQTKQLKRN